MVSHGMIQGKIGTSCGKTMTIKREVVGAYVWKPLFDSCDEKLVIMIMVYGNTRKHVDKRSSQEAKVGGICESTLCVDRNSPPPPRTRER